MDSTNHETIIPLLKIYRKLEHCSTNQSTKFVKNLTNLFFENKSTDLLAKILLSGLCKQHKNISTYLFEKILSILPTEKELNINDTLSIER